MLALAVTAAAAAQGASAAPTLEAVAAACGAGPPTAATADAALALYARGVLEVARPCAVPLLRAARDAAGPPALRLAALRAAARLSSGEPSSAIADEVAALLGDLGGVVGEGAGAADATLALTRWQVRVEHGVLLALLRRSAEAEAALDTALAAAPSTADAAELLRARRCLAVALADGRRAAEAPARARAVLDESERLLGPDHVETLLAALGLGTLLWRVYELPAAELQYERAAAGFARVLGADHAYTLAARQGLGVLALRRGQFQGAVATLGAALVDARRTRADDDPDLAPLALAHASALAETGRLREAEAAFERLEAQQIARHGARDARTLDVQSMLAFVRYWLGDGRGTMRAAEAVLEGRVRSAEPHDPRRLAAEALYASALQLVGRSDEAARRLEQALAVARPVHGPGNDSVLQIELELALAYLESGRTAEALPLLQAIDAAFAGRPAELPHVRLMAEELLALALLRRGGGRGARTRRPGPRRRRRRPSRTRSGAGHVRGARRLPLARALRGARGAGAGSRRAG
ncbi:MAG: tetratricopeptide repeat protein, partial [Comamonadaceae bacterium]|nr:tetratricopeptide repeat protein [Comamonadaceae bacterium]